ncbi:chaperonin 10-like protein [Dunaliella salina]|uniref:enoyl-[acyl-carrier-protein] reductase n=1 Tax=Dunaliella salina TaxID=3046 RepID=A0ABQ7GJK9_DUNSA|nr:chaperonin 10-like protein [Dunaliella salina]|eukprot:KAF5834789.1 chaperonin 10-like protein [Dunaliella salina]
MLPHSALSKAAKALFWTNQRVSFSAMEGFHSKAKALMYDTSGEPEKVLKLQELDVGQPQEGQLLLRFLRAPINPSDINTIQGKYPIKHQLPSIPGHEGVAEVVALGNKVSGFSVGDRVVPIHPGQGTWRTGGVFNAKHFWRVPRDLPLEAAATLCINPTTALAMLERFVSLSPGDVVVQNGATSAVGQAVIQLAKAKGLQTVNIIRDRPNWAETEDWLKKLGADVVTTEEKLLESLSTCSFPNAFLVCEGDKQMFASLSSDLPPYPHHEGRVHAIIFFFHASFSPSFCK